MAGVATNTNLYDNGVTNNTISKGTTDFNGWYYMNTVSYISGLLLNSSKGINQFDTVVENENDTAIDGLDRSKQSHKSQKSQRRALDADDIDYKTSGLPIPLPDVPKITKMTDSSLTLLWLPSIPEQPRFPVSYVVEFAKVPDGNWVLYQSGKLACLGQNQFIVLVYS